jgi:hypothetical protein
MLNAGFDPGQWSSLQNILNHESGFRNTAQNPSSTAFGMFQFLDTTWSSVGGTKTSDPGLQSRYGLQYIKQRYGTPAKAWDFWQAHNWYASGGGVGGTGSGDTVPAMLTPGEHVLTTKDVKALGGQRGVYRMREALHFAPGGAVPEGLFVPPVPLPRPADAKKLQPRPSAPRIASPAPQAPPSLPDAPASAAPRNPQPAFTSPTPTGGASPAVESHTLPAISKGITSGFATAGALAQQAASFGMMAATGGASAAGGGGVGIGGLSISGAFQQFGKNANDVADVASASLVGTLTPGTQESQYGSLMRPAQKIPQTAPLNSPTMHNTFYGHSAGDVIDALGLKQAQDQQAALAQWGG